jgi:hypothetical protein
MFPPFLSVIISFFGRKCAKSIEGKKSKDYKEFVLDQHIRVLVVFAKDL